MNYRCTGKFCHSDGVRICFTSATKDVDFQFVMRDEENHIILHKNKFAA